MLNKLGSSSFVTFLKTGGVEALQSAKSLGHTIKAKIEDFGKTLIKTAANITNIAVKSDVASPQKRSTLPAVTKADQELVNRAVLRAAGMRDGRVGQFVQKHLSHKTSEAFSEGVLSQDFVKKVSEELKATMKGLPKEQQKGFADTLRLMGFEYTEKGELTCSDQDQLEKVLSLIPSVQEMAAHAEESKENRASRFFTKVKDSLHTPRLLADYVVAKGIAKEAATLAQQMDPKALNEAYHDSGMLTQTALEKIRSSHPKLVKYCSPEGISLEVLSKQFDKVLIKEMKKAGATEGDIVQNETRRKVKEVRKTVGLLEGNLIGREEGLSRLAEAFKGMHPGSIEPGDFHDMAISDEIKPFVHALMINLARDTYQRVVSASLFDRVAPEVKVDAIAGYFNLIEGLPPELSGELAVIEVPFDRSALMREYFSLAAGVSNPADLKHLEAEGFAFTQIFMRDLSFEIGTQILKFDSFDQVTPLLFDRDSKEFKQLLHVAEIYLECLSPGNREIVKNNLQEIVLNLIMQKVQQRFRVTREQIEQLKGVDVVQKIQAAHAERTYDEGIPFESGITVTLQELSPEQIVALRNEAAQRQETIDSQAIIQACDGYLSGEVERGEISLDVSRFTNLSTLSKTMALKLFEAKGKEVADGEKDVKAKKTEMKVIEAKVAQFEQLLLGDYSPQEKEQIGSEIRSAKVELLHKMNEVIDKERKVAVLRHDFERLGLIAEETDLEAYTPIEITSKTLFEKKELIDPLEAQIKETLKLPVSDTVRKKLEGDLEVLARIKDTEDLVENDRSHTFTFFATSEAKEMTKEELKELKKPLKAMREDLAVGEEIAASVRDFLTLCHSEDPGDQQKFTELSLFDIDLVNASDALLDEVIALYEKIPDEPGNEDEMHILALLKQVREVPLEDKEERIAIIGDARVDFVFEDFVESVHPDMIRDVERYLTTIQEELVGLKTEITKAEQDLASKETEAAFGPILSYEETRETYQEVQESLKELAAERIAEIQTKDLEELCSQVDASTSYTHLLQVKPAPGEEKAVAAIWKNWALDVVGKISSYRPTSPTRTPEEYRLARDYLSFREILPTLQSIPDEARKEIQEALAEYEKKIPGGIEGLKRRVEGDRLKMEPLGSDKEKAMTPFELQGLELLTRYLELKNSGTPMSEIDRRDLTAFLKHAQGNLRLNAKISLLWQQYVDLPGISWEALSFMRTFTYKTNDFDKLPEIAKRFSIVMETLKADPNATIESEQKLTIAELGLLTRAADLEDDFVSLAEMGLLERLGESDAVGEFQGIFGAVKTASDFLVILDEESVGQSRMRSGDLVFTLIDRDDAFFPRPNRDWVDRGKSHISRFGHAAVAHDPGDASAGSSGRKGLSHIIKEYSYDTLTFETLVLTETYRIDVAKLVRPELISKLKEKYGDDWEKVIQDKFHRISSEFHIKENVKAKLGKVKNTVVRQVRSGAAIFFPFLRKKQPVDELYTRLTQGKPENAEEIERSMMCAEFVVQTTVAGTLRLLNDEIVKDLGEVPDGKVFDVPFEKSESLQYIHTEVIYKKFKKALSKVDPPPILSQILR